MLASIIYNYGKFCDDFKSTLKLGAYLKTARKFFMRRDSGRHIDIIRLMMKYVHAVKDRFRLFQRPLRGISAIHFEYR